jgi:hypothetical protein
METTMPSETSLLPDMRDVCDQLTRNRREYQRLRILRRLIIEADDDRKQSRNSPRQQQLNN